MILNKLEKIGYKIECAYLEDGMGFAGVYEDGIDRDIGDVYELFKNEDWAELADNDMLSDMLQYEYESWLENKEEDETEEA